MTNNKVEVLKAYSKSKEELKVYMERDLSLTELFKAMTYCYASIKKLWDEVDDEEGFITGAIIDNLKSRNYFLDPYKIEVNEEEIENLPSVDFPIDYENYDIKFTHADGNIIYNGTLVDLTPGNGHNIALVVRRYEVHCDDELSRLRITPREIVGCYSLVYP